MNCQVYPKKISWHQDIELGGGVMLRIYGLTSTILSGKDGKDDKPRDLYLSPLQTALDPVEDQVNLVMCHHPADWFVDHDDVEDAINARATFQIFGHKHRQQVVPTPDYIRILAGAVNPSRKEPNYEPGYNLLQIDVDGSGEDRRLKVETHQFRYQANPEGFVPVKTAQGKDCFRSTIAFPGRQQHAGASAVSSGKTGVLPKAAEGNADADAAKEPKPAVVDDVEASMGEERHRDLIYRFWKLDGDKKRQIALGLGLITEAELSRSLSLRPVTLDACARWSYDGRNVRASDIHRWSSRIGEVDVSRGAIGVCVPARDINTRLRFDSLREGNYQHLNEMEARWLNAKEQERTQVAGMRTVQHGFARSGRPTRPDYLSRRSGRGLPAHVGTANNQRQTCQYPVQRQRCLASKRQQDRRSKLGI